MNAIEEVVKQLQIGFLEVTDYSKWLINIVLIPKKDGKVRMCIDNSDLNKANPKDDVSLPHSDILVDNTAVMLYSLSWMTSLVATDPNGSRK